MKPLNPALFFLSFVQVRPWTIHKVDGEGRKKRLQNAQPQKELLRSTGDWGVPQQAASGKVDSQKHRLPILFHRYSVSPEPSSSRRIAGRRLGLPFFDMPANESSISGSDMTAWSPTSYQGNQSWEYYPQRLRYPTSMDNADPSGFAQALEKLGGDNTTMTPLWWAIH